MVDRCPRHTPQAGPQSVTPARAEQSNHQSTGAPLSRFDGPAPALPRESGAMIERNWQTIKRAGQSQPRGRAATADGRRQG
jgi:hypothetical protein